MLNQGGPRFEDTQILQLLVVPGHASGWQLKLIGLGENLKETPMIGD